MIRTGFQRAFPALALRPLLARDQNNLDLVRLICACLVVYGHAFAVTPDPAYPGVVWDPFIRLGLPGIYSASVAVKVFFFISGLLVTHSLLEKQSVRHFVLGRLCRVWPALSVVLVVAAFVVGPLCSVLPLGDYFSDSDVYSYVIRQLLMWSPDHLPGVFLHHPLPILVNGALWTLSYEVGAYGLLLIGWLLGIFRSRWFCALLLVAIALDAVHGSTWIFRWLPANPQVAYLPVCFAFGAFLALQVDRVTLRVEWLVLALVGFIGLRDTPLGTLAFFALVLPGVLYVSGLPWVQKIRLKFDLSYGIFVWGFLVQQLIADSFVHRSFPFKVALALAISAGVASLSWLFIERPALAWARRRSPGVVRRPPAIPQASAESPGVWTVGRRIGLALGLAGLLLLQHWGGVVLDAAEKRHNAAVDASLKLTPALAARLGVVPPSFASFDRPELRYVKDERVLMIHPPCRMEWKVQSNVRAVIIRYGFDSPAYERGSTNGADLIVTLVDGEKQTELFRRRLQPIENPADRGLQTSRIDLPEFSPKARLVLETTGGRNLDTAWDWLYLAGFEYRSRK